MYIPLAQLCLVVRGTLASWKMGALALRQTPGTPPVIYRIDTLSTIRQVQFSGTKARPKRVPTGKMS